jgi:hypothetical protein
MIMVITQNYGVVKSGLSPWRVKFVLGAGDWVLGARYWVLDYGRIVFCVSRGRLVFFFYLPKQ